jgi:hypothetical protein
MRLIGSSLMPISVSWPPIAQRRHPRLYLLRRQVGRPQQQPSSVVGALLHQRDQSAQVLNLGGPQGVKRDGFDRG